MKSADCDQPTTVPKFPIVAIVRPHEWHRPESMELLEILPNSPAFVVPDWYISHLTPETVLYYTDAKVCRSF